jgi:hypothetical protein
MTDDAARFRKHAFECRRLAETAREIVDRQMLLEIADDLDSEADSIERAEMVARDEQAGARHSTESEGA